MASLDGSARVAAVDNLTPDIRAFDILPEGEFIAPASGAHLKIAVQIGDRSDQRCYSIFAASPKRGYRIAVKRLDASRGGSAYMWTLQPGARLSISGPDNQFSLTPGSHERLLIAGGIGITPIHAHAEALARSGAKFRVLYAARSRDDFALGHGLAETLGDRLQLFVSEAGGRIDLKAEFASLPDDGEAYVCGPIGMLEGAKRAWAELGRPMDRLRFETFGASGAWPTKAFTVKIPRLNREIVVPETQTMLEAFEAAGVEMIFDCRRGECGLCALPVLAVDGVVDHRDVFFSEAEKASNAKLCACVSRVYGASVTIDTADR
jgi:vanillate O-demethylase ferredoxin subunit